MELPDGSQIPFQRLETRKLKTLYGDLNLNRAYYWSPKLKKGACPFDEKLGLNDKKLSPKLQEVDGPSKAAVDCKKSKPKSDFIMQ